MSRIVRFPLNSSQKFGLHKAKNRRKPNLEDFGQLNLFDTNQSDGKVVSIHKVENFFERALELDEQHNARAAYFYELAIKNDQSAADAYCNLGIIKAANSDHAGSVDCFTKCLEMNPRHVEAHYNLANVYTELGDIQLAKSHYQISIKLDPEFPDNYYNLSLVLVSLEQYDEAVDMVYQFIEKAPGSERNMAFDLIKTLKEIG